MRNAPRWFIRFTPLLVAGAALAAPPDDKGQGAVEVPFSKQARLSPQEQLTQAREYMLKMDAIAERVTKMKAAAQQEKDVIKLNCVDDKLMQIKGRIAVANKSMRELNDAVSRGDDGARQHEFSRLTILHSTVETLRAEADNCVGEVNIRPGEQATILVIDPSIPVDDPTATILPDTQPPPREPESSPIT